MGALDERLCEVVRRYPHIYNSSLKGHKDVLRCTETWKEIAQTLDKDESFCRQRWKYLRDRYVKAKRKTGGKGGDASGSDRSPHIMTMLSWLSSFVRHRETDSSILGDMTECPPRKIPRTGTKLLQPGPLDTQPLPPGPPLGSGPGTTSPVVPRRQQALEFECIASGSSVTDTEQETFSGNQGQHASSAPWSPSPSENSDQHSSESPFPSCQGSRKLNEPPESSTETMTPQPQKSIQEGGCEEFSFGQYVSQVLLKMGQKTRSCVKFEINQVLHKWEMEPHRDDII